MAPGPRRRVGVQTQTAAGIVNEIALDSDFVHSGDAKSNRSAHARRHVFWRGGEKGEEETKHASFYSSVAAHIRWHARASAALDTRLTLATMRGLLRDFHYTSVGSSRRCPLNRPGSRRNHFQSKAFKPGSLPSATHVRTAESAHVSFESSVQRESSWG